VEILKPLYEAVRRKRPELWSNDWIFHHDNASADKALSVKGFLPQKLVTKTEHQPYSTDLAPNDFWLFSETMSALKGRRFQDTEISKQKKSDKGTGSYSTTGIPKMFPTVAASLN
jgi:hypothetical protein